MDKKKARAIFDATRETTQAIVNANPDLSFKAAGMMFDHIFLGLLSDKLGQLKISELFRIIGASD